MQNRSEQEIDANPVWSRGEIQNMFGDGNFVEMKFFYMKMKILVC